MNRFMDLILLSIFSLFVISQSSHVKFKDCGSTGLIQWVDVSPCDSTPCVIKFGQIESVNISINFTAKRGSENCVVVDYAIIHDLPVPEPLIYDTNACKSGVHCPIKAGDTNVYATTVYVQSGFPKGNITVRWELLDDRSDMIICMEVPVTLE